MSAAGWRSRRRRSGVEVYPGFACSDLVFGDDGAVRGVVAGVFGLDRQGKPKPDYQPGMELIGKYVLIAEGARGSLARRIIERYELRTRQRAAEIRPRHEGAVGGQARGASPGSGHPHHGLAALQRDRRRLLHVPPRGQSGFDRLRRPSQLREPLSLPLYGIPAVQAPSADRAGAQRRAAHRLWRPRDHRGRAPIGAEALLPGRRADRLCGGFRQRAADQGHPTMR